MRSPLEELVEKQAIAELVHRYALALDRKDWALLDRCFTPDARLDYRSAGGPAGAYHPELRKWLVQVLEPIPVMQHLVSNLVIELDGDRARATVYGVNVNRMGPDESGPNLVCGGIYHDRLVKGEDGWRFCERVEERTFVEGVLPELPR
jgi:hypothetical protein